MSAMRLIQCTGSMSKYVQSRVQMEYQRDAMRNNMAHRISLEIVKEPGFFSHRDHPYQPVEIIEAKLIAATAMDLILMVRDAYTCGQSGRTCPDPIGIMERQLEMEIERDKPNGPSAEEVRRVAAELGVKEKE